MTLYGIDWGFVYMFNKKYLRGLKIAFIIPSQANWIRFWDLVVKKSFRYLLLSVRFVAIDYWQNTNSKKSY